MKNIRTFLKVCHDKFGLRNSELFDPFDLFDVRDFGKVSGLFPGAAGERAGPGPSPWSGWVGEGWGVLQTGGGGVRVVFGGLSGCSGCDEDSITESGPALPF